MSYRVLQSAEIQRTAVLTSDLAFPGNVTAGSLLIVASSVWDATVSGAAWQIGSSATPVLAVNTSTSVTARLRIFYAENASAGAHTARVTLSATSDVTVAVTEYAGIATSGALDVTQAQNSATNAATITSTATGTLAQARNLVLSTTNHDFNGTPSIQSSDLHTRQVEVINSTGMCLALADKRSQSTAGVTATWNYGASVPWRVAVAVFKEAASSDPDEPVLVACGTASSATSGNITPVNPTHVANDVLLLKVHSSDNIAHSVSGWTQLDQHTNGTAQRVSTWWLRATGAGTTNPTVTHTAGGPIIGQVDVWRNCIASGDPVRASSWTNSGATNDFILDSTALSGLSLNDAIIFAGFYEDDPTTATQPLDWVAPTNGVQTTTSGTDAGLYTRYKRQETAGSSDTPSVTVSGGTGLGASPHVVGLIALMPASAAATTAYKDAAGRLRLLVSAWRDAVARLRLRVQSYRDAASRLRLRVQAFRDAATRLRLHAQAFRDAAGRLRLAVVLAAIRDTAGRLRLAAQGYRDGAIRFVLRVATTRDTAGRLRLAVLRLGDAGGRLSLRVTRYRDAAARFVLVVPAAALRDAVARLRVKVGAYDDAAARLRLAVQTVRDRAARLRVRATAYRETAGRFVLVSANAGIRDVAARLRVRALALRDLAARLRLRVTTTADAAGRVRLAVRVLRDAASRLRLRVQGYRDAASRFVLVVPGAALRDAAARVRLRVPAVRDLAVRVRLSVARWVDATGRFVLRAPGMRDVAGRLRLIVPGVALRDTAARLRQRPGLATYATADGANPGGWTTDTGATTGLFGRLDETTPDDADYVQSPLAPSGNAVTFALGALPDPGVDDGTRLRLRYGKDDPGQEIDVLVELLAGGVPVATRTYPDVPLGWQEASEVLSPAELQAFRANGGFAFGGAAVRVTATAN